jgi:hypothetical protein
VERPDGIETSEVAWFEPAAVVGLSLTPVTHAVLERLL